MFLVCICIYIYISYDCVSRLKKSVDVSILNVWTYGQDVIGVEDKDLTCVSPATYHLSRIHDIIYNGWNIVCCFKYHFWMLD